MKLELSQQQLYWKNIVERCISGEITTRGAAMEVGYTMRAIQKMIIRYKKKGDAAFVHGNNGRKRNNPEREELRNRIINIFQTLEVDGVKVWDDKSTYACFKDFLRDFHDINVSTSWVRKILLSIGHVSSLAHRRKRKDANHPYRERMANRGELVQADGSQYDWLSDGKKYTIQGFVDDATGYPVGLYMTKNECTLGYTEALRTMLTNEGAPVSLYPDKAEVFFVNNPVKDPTEKHLTQFGLMMENLGIDMFPAHSPQAKGRIERFWQTIQHRLPTLFRYRGIKTMEAANTFLEKEFLAIYRRWFPVEPRESESHFVTVSVNDINRILKATFPGKTDRGGVFLLKGYRFFCPELLNQRILIHMNEKEGLWVTTRKPNSKRYEIKLVETDTTGTMPEVMKDLIERVFLRNAKPKFREVYIDIDDVVLSQVKPKRTA